MYPGRFAQLRSCRLLVAGVLSLCVLVGCSNEPTKVETSGTTTVSGRVVHVDDMNRGVPAVLVRAVGEGFTATTDSAGRFEMAVSVVEARIMQFAISKLGFDEVVTSLSVQPGQRNAVATPIPLHPAGTTGGSSSDVASTIFLATNPVSTIGVRQSGSSESVVLTYEVRDAHGRPVSLDHRTTVEFTLNQVSGGGAFIHPDTATTNSSGRVQVTLNSGMVAQAVQVRARLRNTSIFSAPVRVAIHGGLPNAEHFSFAVEKVNIPGLVRFGLTSSVTAFVGDRYGNPVPTGTIVYFSTRVASSKVRHRPTHLVEPVWN